MQNCNIMENFKEDIAYKRVRKKVREIRGFYYHLVCYCIVIPILIFVNLRFTPEFYWFPFSMCGWGIGLLFHSMEVFGYMPFFNKDWEARKLRELMEKEKEKESKLNNQ